MATATKLAPARAFLAVDWLYLGWFVTLGVIVAVRRAAVPGWGDFVLLHVAVIAAIVLLAYRARESAWAARVRDWYPLALFVVGFEETARFSFLLQTTWCDAAILRFERAVFGISPNLWLREMARPWLTELGEFGYFALYPILVIVPAVLYRQRSVFRAAMFAIALTYCACYAVFIAWPTEGPMHTLQLQPLRPSGLFHRAVLLIQGQAGVHGNAFPSGHVAAVAAAVVFAWRARPPLGRALLPAALLMALGAVYDGYHYVSDVVAGGIVGCAVAAIVLRTSARFRI